MYSITQADGYCFSGSRPDSSVYVLDIVRTPSNGLVTISSDQALSLFDPTNLRNGPATSLKTDHGNLTTLSLFGESVVCTAGENGTVSVWDLRERKSVAHFTASEAPILSMACSPSTSTIAVGTELQNHQASILLWDVRGAQPTAKAAYHDLHSDDVTQLAFHPSPSQAQLLLSGSTDGLVSVHDTSVADEDELTVQTLNLNASIHRAAFIGGSGAQAQATSLVGALSHDERFAVYDVAEERGSGDAVRDFGDLRAVLGCQYVADVVPKADGSGAILGAGSQDKAMFQLCFLSQTQEGVWELDQESAVGIPGAHGEEIVRAFCFFDEEQTVFTAGEDGMVKAWRPGG